MIPTEPFFTVVTPSWNRAHLLNRVFRSLSEQTFTNFEWILANDGSSDDTSVVAHDLMQSKIIPIHFIEANKRVGKLRLDNEAILKCRGELVLWCDSDDYLLPEALQILYDLWMGIPYQERGKYSGLTGVASTRDGQILHPFANEKIIDTTWNDIFGAHTKGSKTQDMVLCVTAKVLKTNLFPEVDFVAPEGVVWTKIGNMKTKLISKPLKFVEYGHIGAISYSNKMEYNRGRAIALAQIFSEMRKYDTTFNYQLRNSVNYHRYVLHGEIKLSKAKDDWCLKKMLLFNYFAILLAFCYFLKDRVFKKVIKTHKEFEKNNRSAQITYSRNYD